MVFRYRRFFLGLGGRSSGFCCGWFSSFFRLFFGVRISFRGSVGAVA